MIGVVGGGFGLYGHLVALVELGRPVATLARYRDVLLGRAELAPLADRIGFVETEAELIGKSELLVLARRPQDNAAIASAVIAQGAGKRLVMEKPIAPDPASALALHEALGRAGVAYWTPFLFRHTAWSMLLGKTEGDIDIVWRFPPRNSPGSWKYDAQAGGGILAYYLIHFLPFAVEWSDGGEPARLESSTGQADERMCLSARGARGALRVTMELAAAEPAFEIRSAGALIFREQGPLGGAGQRGAPDPRLPALRRFYRDEVFTGQENARKTYGSVWRLWDALAASAK